MDAYDRVTLALAAGAALGAMLLASPDAHAQTIQEDDPGWNCITMGDRSCGPTNSNGGFRSWLRSVGWGDGVDAGSGGCNGPRSRVHVDSAPAADERLQSS